jgi:hypothetical protein
MKVFYDGVKRNVFFSEIENRWVERQNEIAILVKEVDVDIFDLEIDTELDLEFSPVPGIKHVEVIDYKGDTSIYTRLKVEFDESVTSSKEELIKSCITKSTGIPNENNSNTAE